MVSIIKEDRDVLIDYDDECPICYESLKEKDIQYHLEDKVSLN